MTKTQAKKLIQDLYDKGCLGKLNAIVSECMEELDNLIYDVEDTRDSIEPYENKDDLTEQQQERYEWFDEFASDLQTLRDYLDDIESELGDNESTLTERE